MYHMYFGEIRGSYPDPDMNNILKLLANCLACLLVLGFSTHTYALKLIGTRVVDLDSNIHQLGMQGTLLKPVMVSFLQPSCQSPTEINALAKVARAEGFVFYGVVPAGVTWQAAKAYSQQARFDFPVFLDADGNLQTELKPTQSGKLALLSRFDKPLSATDPAVSKKLQGAIKQYQTDNANGGCEISEFKVPEAVTYNQHIAPMLQSNCIECHKPNGIAPFDLVGYQQARNFAPVIAFVTEQKIMPPWKATPGSGHYLNERVLSDLQIDLLKRWSQQGAKEGPADAKVPMVKIDASEWRLGEPDIIISMPEAFDIPASGPDIYRYFVIKDAIPKDLEIAAIDFQPGDASVVHHSNFFVDYGRKARKRDAEDDELGFSVFGTGGFFSYWDKDNSAAGLGAWAPGGNPIKYPDGIGMKLPGGADFVFEIHYHPTGKAAKDKSRLGIYLAAKPIKKEVSSLFMGTNRMSIEAGEQNHKRHFWMELPEPMKLVDIAPHMHYLGTHANVVATLPSGEKQTLLDTVWDFRWQGAYYYREPVELPAGTRIDAHFEYDNSNNNPYNPYNPPVRATWGWGTDQEMGELYLTVMAKNNRALNKLKEAARISWLRPSEPELSMRAFSTEEIVNLIIDESTWQDRGESLLLMLVDSDQRIKEVEKLVKRRIKQNPEDDRYRALLGSFYGIQATFASSITQYYLYGKVESEYQKALELNPNNWDARYGLATGYAMEKSARYQKLAGQYFLHLIQQQEKENKQHSRYAKVYIDLGGLFAAQGNKKAAKEVWRQGLKFHPGHLRLKELSAVN